MPQILYPVFWANDASVSFVIVIPPEEFRQLMADTEFEERIWEDVTAQIIEGASRQQAGAASEAPAIGLHLVYDNVPEKGLTQCGVSKRGVLSISRPYLRELDDNYAIEVTDIALQEAQGRSLNSRSSAPLKRVLLHISARMYKVPPDGEEKRFSFAEFPCRNLTR